MCSSLVAATRAVYLEDCIMNKDQVKGVAQKMKGKVNEAIGRVRAGRPGNLKATSTKPRDRSGKMSVMPGKRRKTAQRVISNCVPPGPA
jgi:hypothetical protein